MRRYLKNTPLEEAVSSYLEWLKDRLQPFSSEEIPSAESLGRITSEAVYAKLSSPHYYASAMDGIAVVAKRTFQATETTPVVLKEHEDYEVVDTGDPLPEGFDAVIMEEDAIRHEQGFMIHQAAAPFQHVRQIGEDICAGEMLLPSNTPITPSMIAALLAGGVFRVEVFKKPIVGILPTGDEIVAPGVMPQKGQIIESNSALFSACL
ncbi:MAG: molybdopterin biosynthesis protein, partial [Clostridia bacterium]|nr:molybdopterin biosynthesis protein [Clostridia bacterium]